MSTSTSGSYSIVITLYDPSLTPTAVSPLLPSTSTRLAPDLDRDLHANLDRLVLPPTRADFWQVSLHRSKRLDLDHPATLSATHSDSHSPALAPAATTNPRIWSQHLSLASPPLAIQTSQLWTPSQALPSTSRARAVLDFRFGPIEIDWVKLNSAATPLEMDSGTTSLMWGTVHLYREHGTSTKPATEADQQRAVERDDGTTLALVSVPGIFNAAGILKFIRPALNDLEHVRMVRDSSKSRSIVVLKFTNRDRAQEFNRMFNGKTYHDSKDSELCHVVPISSVLLKPTSLPPYTFPCTPSPSLLVPKPAPSKPSNGTPSAAGDTTTDESGHKTELPLCPICLERLDQKVTGLVQIQCQHSYHCTCLLKWGDSRCPVCRATNLQPRSSATKSSNPTESDTNKCAVCTSPSNLWICLICGNVGCGRYQGGHAHSHFSETGHSYSLELETGRIWSYTDDEYVHRLLRVPSSSLNNNNNNDKNGTSRLIELPSLPPLSPPGLDQDISSKIASSYNSSSGGGGIGGPDRTHEEEQSKVERIAIEYSLLLQSNLEQQRFWFEDELAREQELNKEWSKRFRNLELELGNERKRVVQLERDRTQLQLEQERNELSNKTRLEIVEKLAKKQEEERRQEKLELVRIRKRLEHELEQEKSVTTNLTANLGSIRKELVERQVETDTMRLEVEELRDQLNDVMTALTMRDRIELEPEGSELRGATIAVQTPNPTSTTTSGQTPSQELAAKRKKKNKKK
ncbi:uncharacterized protein JCM15063_001363 [Sporobolomyces koalae]|uniref:uncharacterized protein n=1 Tax=Sporobolomyces koalae TaxID=500713 RepID=UPI00317836C1